MAGFVSQHPRVNSYLPDGKEVLKMPKAWIACVINTVMGVTFSNWVKEQINVRNNKILVENGLAIEMDQEVADVFNASTKTSGKYNKSLRTSNFSLLPQCCKDQASTCSRRTQSADAPKQRSHSKSRRS